MSNLWLDIETFSCTDLRKSGVYRYVEDPTFELLMCGWSTDGEHVQMAIGEDEIRAIPGLFDPKVTKVAHNAAFERVCFSRLAGLPTGTYLPAKEYRDTQALAGELGWPQKLDSLARSLGAEQKDTAGTRLINLFCKPNRKGQRVLPADKPEHWAEFVDYCRQDVVALIDVDRRMGSAWPTSGERRVWLADQLVNDRGIRIDVPMAERAVDAAKDNRMLHELEISAITGIANPGSPIQLLDWLKSSGLRIGDLQAATVEKALRGDLSAEQRRVLQLRQELALTASAKYQAALDSVCEDGRLRGTFRFFGAHTGRWAGRGLQPHNLPRAALADEAAVDTAILDLMLGQGADSFTLKALVRSLLQLDGAVVDYAAIEARVVAWLAGEEWALQAFRDGRDIYVETAERMGGSRAQGKVAVLALGYNGGIGSLQVMGAKGNDEELQWLVQQWRRANPSIVRLWRTMETAFRFGGKVGEHLTIETDGNDRLMRLPSGRAIAYRKCAFGDRISFSDPRRNGARSDTYGGRLVENATQAVARDVLAEALVRLIERGYSVVGHVHDEILVEQTEDLDLVRKVMVESPSWAAGLPIDGEGFVCGRYRKG